MKIIKRIFYYCFILLLCAGCANKPSFSDAFFTEGQFEIRSSDIIEGTPLFFKTIEGISFFVIKVNGHVGSYFNACSRCYTSKKGFRVEKSRLICRVCNVGYPFDSLDTGIASCFPLILHGANINGSYIIKKDEVLKGSRYF
jgi:hypothetical protein